MKNIKSDAEFRQELVQLIKEFLSFSESVKGINKSISYLNKSLYSSMQLLPCSLCNT